MHVTLKPGVLDPQGTAIAAALRTLGFDDVADVRQGKFIEIELKAADAAQARESVDAMCRKLLANPVVETYSVDIAS